MPVFFADLTLSQQKSTLDLEGQVMTTSLVAFAMGMKKNYIYERPIV